MTDSTGETDRVADALGEWFARRDTPDPLSPEELLARYPDVADELRKHLRFLDAAGGIEEPPRGGGARPRRLGGYDVLDLVGEGGMGRVYRARDDAGRTVALKVLRPHLFHVPSFVDRFRREAAIGRRIEHPNVVATIDVGSEQHGTHVYHFLVLEFVDGASVFERLREEGRLDEATCRRVGADVAAALGAIHAAGAVHRDVKPANVLLTSGGVAKVTDLGVARLQREAVRVSHTGSFVGSLRYAAPEQFLGVRSLDGRTDLHGLGVLLYEMCTGEHPFGHDEPGIVIPRILSNAPRPPTELRPDLDPALEAVILRLLAKDPTDRYATAADVASALVT